MSAGDARGIDDAAAELAEAIRGVGDATVDIGAMAERFGLEPSHVEDCLAAIEALEAAIGEDLPDEVLDVVPPLPDGLRVTGELGRGGMGVVYRAHQASLDRDVAIKVLCPGQRVFGEMLRRFRDEARHLARLRHPNIVSIHDVGELDGNVYYTMDLIEGESLATMIARGPLTPSQTVRLLRQVCAAIGYSHSRGILHRDLKPSNVLVDDQGTAYVVDFGLARDVDSVDHGNTHSGQILGTPAYMSPEQARGDRAAIGETTDVYALGATLYECLSGRPPFRGRPLAELVMAVIHQDPPPLERVAPSVPEPLAIIVGKALEKDPERRYPTVQALREDLERFVEGQAPLARRPGLVYRSRRWLSRHRSLLGAAVASVAAVLLVAWALVLPRWEERSLIQAAEQLSRSGRFEAAISLYHRADRVRDHAAPLGGDLDNRLFHAAWNGAVKARNEGRTDASHGLYRSADFYLSRLRQVDRAHRWVVPFYYSRLCAQLATTDDVEVLRAGLRDLRAANHTARTSDVGHPAARALRWPHQRDGLADATRLLARMWRADIDRPWIVEVLHRTEAPSYDLLPALLDLGDDGRLLARLVVDTRGWRADLAALTADAARPDAQRVRLLDLLCDVADLPYWIDRARPGRLDDDLLTRALALERRLRDLAPAERYRAAVSAAIERPDTSDWLAARTGGAAEGMDAWLAWWASARQQSPDDWLRTALGAPADADFAALHARFAAEPFDARRHAAWHHLLALAAPANVRPPIRRFGVRGARPTTRLRADWEAATRGLLPGPRYRYRVALVTVDTPWPTTMFEQTLTAVAGRQLLTQPGSMPVTVTMSGPLGVSLPKNATRRAALPLMRHELTLTRRGDRHVCTLRDRAARWETPSAAAVQAPLGRVMAQLVHFRTPDVGVVAGHQLGLLLAIVEPADTPDAGATADRWRARIAADLEADGDADGAILAACWLDVPDARAALARRLRSASDPTLADRLRIARWLAGDADADGGLADALERMTTWSARRTAIVSHGGIDRHGQTEELAHDTAQLLTARVAAAHEALRDEALGRLRGTRLSVPAARVLGAAVHGRHLAPPDWLAAELAGGNRSQWWQQATDTQRTYIAIYCLLGLVLALGALWPRQPRRIRAASWLVALGLLPFVRLVPIDELVSTMPVPPDAAMLTLGSLILAREAGSSRWRWLLPLAFGADLVLSTLASHSLSPLSQGFGPYVPYNLGLLALPVLLHQLRPAPLARTLTAVCAAWVLAQLTRCALLLKVIYGDGIGRTGGHVFEVAEVVGSMALVLIAIAIVHRAHQAARTGPVG